MIDTIMMPLSFIFVAINSIIALSEESH